MKTKAKFAYIPAQRFLDAFAKKSCQLQKKKRKDRSVFEKLQNRKLFQEMTSLDSIGCSENYPSLHCSKISD